MTNDNKEKVLDTLIEELFQFSNRPSNVLKNNNIRTLRDLLSLTEEEIKQVRGIGKSYLEIERKLAEYGLYLGGRNEEVVNIVEKIKTDNKNNTENKKILEEKLKDLKERYDKEVATVEKEYTIGKYTNTKTFDINFYSLAMLLTERKISIIELSQATGVNCSSLRDALRGSKLLRTDTLAKIGAYLKVPISNLVLFNGYEIKPEFAVRYGVLEDFEIPEIILGEPTYQPLRDFVKSLYQYKTLSNLFDEIETAKDDRKLNGKKVQVLGEPKTKKREYKGLGGPTRVKIMHNEAVNIKTIYKICKLLQCNIDFVFGWK